MINILRKNQKWLWIVIGILAIPFCFYFVKTDPAAFRSDRFGQIYGRNITRVDFQRSVRLLNLARSLGLTSFVQDMVGAAQSENEAYAAFTGNQIILHHEADRFGIAPNGAEIAGAVRTFPPFQGSAGFDLKKYTDIVQNSLPSLGFSESEIEELARDQISLDRIKALVTSGLNIPQAEIKANYQRAYGKIDTVVARFRNQDFAKQISVNDGDIAKYFDAHKADLQTEPKRKVDFVSFALTDAQKKLTGKERIDVLQKLADRANDFTQALLEKGADFKQAAAKFQAPVQTTGDFSASAPDPLLKSDPQLAQSAFQLSADASNSDAIQSADGFYIMHLAGVTPARPLTLEEAKPKIVETLNGERLHQLMASKAAEAVKQVREKLKAGATAEAALQQTGLKPERIAPFSLLEIPSPKTAAEKDKPKAADFSVITQAVAELNPGEVSEFTPTPDGGLIAVMEKREPVDAKQFDQERAPMEGRYLESMRRVILLEWLRVRRADSGFQIAQG